MESDLLQSRVQHNLFKPRLGSLPHLTMSEVKSFESTLVPPPFVGVPQTLFGVSSFSLFFVDTKSVACHRLMHSGVVF